MKTKFCGRCLKRASKRARLTQKMAIARSEVATTAKSEFCLLRCKLHGQSHLTSVATDPNRKSNDSVQAHDRQVTPLLLNQRTIAQKPLHQSRNRAVQPQEVNERESNARKSANRNVPRQPADAKDALNVGRQTVRQRR